MKQVKRFWILSAVLGLLAAAPAVRADELPEKYKTSVTKGLDYLVKQQFKDGHWGANGDNYPVSMTGLAGLALLMEGSTVREGKYGVAILSRWPIVADTLVHLPVTPPQARAGGSHEPRFLAAFVVPGLLQCGR